MNPIKSVAITPRSIPDCLNANGIARIPVPKTAFNKCVSVSKFL